MKVTSQDNVKVNMQNIVSNFYEGEICDSLATLKAKSFVVLNNYQKVKLFSGDSFQPNLVFNSSSIYDFLVKESVTNIDYEKTLFMEDEKGQYEDMLEESLEQIAFSDSDLHSSISLLTGTISAHNINNLDGGSISNAIGLIYICPKSKWHNFYLAEMLVHENTHNAIFLEDLVKGVFPNLDALNDPDAHAVSAIRKQKRAFDKVYHSICVVASICRFYDGLNEFKYAEHHVEPAIIAIKDITESIKRMEGKGIEILTSVGHEILREAKDIIYSYN